MPQGENDTLGLVVAHPEMEIDLKPCNWSTVLGERKQLPLPCQYDVSEEGGQLI